MNAKLKTLLQFVLGIGLAGAMLFLVYKDKSWDQLYHDLSQADIFWVGLAGLTLFVIFITRALRWQMMLESSGYTPTKKHTFASILILYLVNSLTPKVGEIVRCSILFKTDKVPVSSALGTVISERVIDALVLFLGVGIIFLFEIERLGELFGSIVSNLTGMLAGIPGTYLALGFVGAAVALGGGFVFMKSKSQEDKGILAKVADFIRKMYEAAKSVLQLEKPWLFFVYTFLIWFFLALMNFFFIMALPDTQELGLYFGLLILFIGGIGWALPVPGGMGSTHFIVVQLFLAFGLSETVGQNIGALSNGIIWIFSVGYGLLALAWLMYYSYRQPKEILASNT